MKEKFEKKLKELHTIKNRLEDSYQQILGQINAYEDMLKEIEEDKSKENA